MGSVVIMGVAASGKTSLGIELSQLLGWSFVDGDKFHSSASIELLRSGIPLTDADRAFWLHDISAALKTANSPIILACSALKVRYREQLRSASPNLRFIFLEIGMDSARTRLIQRGKKHFFSENLLGSQFQILEPPGQEKGVLCLDGTLPLLDLVAVSAKWISSGHAV